MKKREKTKNKKKRKKEKRTGIKMMLVATKPELSTVAIAALIQQ